jgi:hypothetical protein
VSHVAGIVAVVVIGLFFVGLFVLMPADLARLAAEREHEEQVDTLWDDEVAA